jgi:aconitate hydratase
MVSHLVDGNLQPGEESGLRIGHALTQDSTGSILMLELKSGKADSIKFDLVLQRNAI